MKKIVFGITSLNMGGAERVLVDICNKLCDKYDITIFTIYSKGKFEKELLDKVNLQSLCEKSFEELSSFEKLRMSLKILLLKKQIYKKYISGKYDTVISFLEGPITNLFSCKEKSNNKIAWVHNDIDLVFGDSVKSKLKKIVNKNAYRKYDKLVFVSQDNLDKFNKVYSDVDTEKFLIYNYIDADKILHKSEEEIQFEFPEECVNFLSVSRLVTQKAIDRLINVHARLIQDGYMHNIYIIGRRTFARKTIKSNKNFGC